MWRTLAHWVTSALLTTVLLTGSAYAYPRVTNTLLVDVETQATIIDNFNALIAQVNFLRHKCDT